MINPFHPAPAWPGRGIRLRWTYVVLLLTLLCVLMPFLFWRSTWFGRPLSDVDMEKYLTSPDHPRQTQHALSQVADRIVRGDQTARRWYPEIVRLAGSQLEQNRNTAAWVMGQDNSAPEFHQALLRLVRDPEPMVRNNAALSLVRFGDASGRSELIAMLRPYVLLAAQAGTLAQRLKPADVVNPGTLVARIRAGKEEFEVRSPVPGTLQNWLAANYAPVSTQQQIALLDPSPQTVWEALRALYLVGKLEDLPDVVPYARGVDGMPAQIQQQAVRTLQEIRSRSGS